MTVKKGYIDTDEGQVHYRYAGREDSESTLVLLHQNRGSSHRFVETMELLKEHFYVIAPDTPGAGLSYHPDEVPSMGYYADVLLQALETLEIGSFHLCGHHTGASIAVEMCTKEPVRVRSVSLSGPPYLTEAERETFKQSYGNDILQPLDQDGEYLLDHWHNHASMGGSTDLELRHRLVIDTLLGRDGIAQTYGVIWDQDFVARFDAIKQPRMIMCGPDDVLWDAFVRARTENPEVRAVELSGGTYAPLEKPAEFADAVRSFITDCTS